jgi:hypothetical protein
MSLQIQKRFEKIVYTLKHKKAYLQVEKKLRGKNTLRGYLHDIDKPFLYMAFWISLKDVQDIHRKHSKHHVTNGLTKNKDDLIDAVIDWECARMTKPDKPLNAYDTLMKFYPEYKQVYLPIIQEFLPEQIRPSVDNDTSIWNNPNEQNRLLKLRFSQNDHAKVMQNGVQHSVTDKTISR